MDTTSLAETEISEVPFTVVDIEATGGNPATDSIIEIAGFVTLNGTIARHYHSLVNPGRNLPPFITALTGITEDMIRDKPLITDILPGFLRFIEDTVLVAHNAKFDTEFLKIACARYGLGTLNNGILCTRRLARQVFTWLPGYDLGTLANALGVEITDRHRAYGDALATVAILHRILEYLKHKGVNTLCQVYLLERGSLRLN